MTDLKPIHLPTTTSTMDVAKQVVEQGDTTTNMVMADHQVASRGRHNRPWLTFGAPYSMQATYILRPAEGAHLPLIIALALYDAVKPHIGTRKLQIKWPNDLLLDGLKLSGILCENVGNRASLVGIGVNINPPQYIPETFKGTFVDAPVAPEMLASSIWACLQPLLALYEDKGWSLPLHESYLQRCATIGQTVHWIRSDKNELTGLVRGLTPNGHLELVAEDGTVHVIHSGEIFDKR